MTETQLIIDIRYLQKPLAVLYKVAYVMNKNGYRAQSKKLIKETAKTRNYIDIVKHCEQYVYLKK